MKVRNGFVSNSSSSSFLIYGITVDGEEELRRMMGVEEPAEDGDEEAPDYYDLLDKASDFGLEHHSTDYNYYIGLSWDRVKDDETGKQFKERVLEGLKKMFPKATPDELQPRSYEETYYC